MPQRVEQSTVNLTVKTPVEIEPGVILPPGSYRAIRKKHGLPTMQGVSWTRPQYKIELTASQLASYGAKNTNNFVSIEYDVTKFVGKEIAEQ